MSAPTVLELEAMNLSFMGMPFVRSVPVDKDSETMDLAFMGQPFIAPAMQDTNVLFRFFLTF